MKPIDIMCLEVGQMAANCYVLSDSGSGQAAIIDPGDDAEYIIDYLTAKKLKPSYIVATHGHFDHIMAAFALQATYKIPFLLHPLDAFFLPRMQDTAKHFLGLKMIDPPPMVHKSLKLGGRLKIGNIYMEVISTPGHTPGSISLYQKESRAVFVGDLLFADGAVGRTDHEYSSSIDLYHSIRTILQLPDETIVYPGHGTSTSVELAKHYFKV